MIESTIGADCGAVSAAGSVAASGVVMSQRVGFVGLGNIGKPMALRLLEAGLPTTVFDVARAPVAELVAAGAKAASSARELAAESDVIGVCVRDDADVMAVVSGDEGLLAGAAPGAVVALHSTILPRTVHAVARLAEDRGVGVIDAPMTGGAFGATRGTLTYMVGGAPEHLERCRPAIETSAAKIVHAGELGSGAAVKLCNNLMTYLGFTAAFEAMLLADASGLSQKALHEVTRSNGNLNDQQAAFLGIYSASAGKRHDEGFQALLRSFADLAEKDLAVTLAFARENGVTLPATGLCQQLMARVYNVRDDRRR
ncbi:MAG: NAD(P)-dependent oxidoreductase [Myxococcota bacterium]